MFNATSTQPAPKPSGIQSKQRKKKLSVYVNPKSPTAVKKVLAAVTVPVPNRCIIGPLNKLETTVPVAAIIDMMPPYATGTFNVLNMEGQPEPSKASGNPRLINAR